MFKALGTYKDPLIGKVCFKSLACQYNLQSQLSFLACLHLPVLLTVKNLPVPSESMLWNGAGNP